ncbi:hypothetical protein A2572_00645 [Candidatus Collierbacteria bacterium RIFOXYD1_FULL_40_9]|uniref:DUF2975 domain-containing protein n=1 Tax=Candidatus Collierbacteria bacterium RIFOXYD1_FULL_40_9 TaxID=1817731 RepID=A0A1F5FWP9_9BACT|nr:MAG: hypothetical protein A2572_00645 [Candidatus Collierbacteria bacterium RIFOXYD1_FULL_40_9]
MNIDLKNRLIAGVLALPAGFFIFLFFYRQLSGGAKEILLGDGVLYYVLLTIAFLVPSVLEILFLYKLSVSRIALLKSLDEASLNKKVRVMVLALGSSLLLAAIYQLIAYTVIYIAGATRYMIFDILTLVYVTLSFFFAKVGDYLKYLFFEKKNQTI